MPERLLWAWSGLNLLATILDRSLRQQINADTLPEDIPTENIPNSVRGQLLIMQQSILLETLATVRKRIQQLRECKEIIGEENTKATLIEPVFWN